MGAGKDIAIVAGVAAAVSIPMILIARSGVESASILTLGIMDAEGNILKQVTAGRVVTGATFTSLQEGQSYTAYATVTNATKKGTSPAAASLTASLTVGTTKGNIVNESKITRDYSAGQSQNITWPAFTIPVSDSVVNYTGSIIATVMDPSGSTLDRKTIDGISVVIVPLVYGATITVPQY